MHAYATKLNDDAHGRQKGGEEGGKRREEGEGSRGMREAGRDRERVSGDWEGYWRGIGTTDGRRDTLHCCDHQPCGAPKGNWTALSKAESKITIILHRIIIVDMSLISSILGDLGDAPHRYRHIRTHRQRSIHDSYWIPVVYAIVP